MSRAAAVRSARPSIAQRAADRAFIRQLRDRHEQRRHSTWTERQKAASLRLVVHVFEELGLEGHDPSGKLQQYLSIFDPAAIRQAAVIVSVHLDRGHLQVEFAHRYLAKVIHSTQKSLDLERQADEVLALCRLQAQDWVATEPRSSTT